MVASTAAATDPPSFAALASQLLAGLSEWVRQFQVAYFNKTPTVSFDAAKNIVHAATVTGGVQASDPDGDALTYTVGRPANGGSVVIDAAGNFTYAPPVGQDEAGYADSFTVTVSDASAGGIHGPIGWFVSGFGSTATTTVTVNTGETAGGATSTSAAAVFGWGKPTASVDFTDESALGDWWVYDGAGNGGVGRRTPDAVSFDSNGLVITGDSNGDTGGMMWQQGQQYGAWEVRVRVPEGAQDYNAVALLWPSTDKWPGDGEVDFLELKNDATRHNVTGALHYSPDGQTDKWIGGNVDVDATQWHNYAVEWTPTEMTFYVDAVPYFTTTDVENFPSTAMQLCLQFDVAGSDLAGGGQMEVAWARMYSLDSITTV
jgi:hypothetical protein